jgi:ATP-dependent helicase HrpB
MIDLGGLDLPVNEVLPDLVAALRERPNAVLVAPPGAGKTTTVPLALLQAGYSKILLLEPRRLAARAAAMRMAFLLGEPVGKRVGFRTRLESAISGETVIEVITEGLLTSRLLADPGLTGVNCVIFDEVHERSLEADLALALVLDLQRGLRPELRVVAMSATADAGRLAALLAAPVIESDGRMHAVEVVHSGRDIPTARELPEAVAKAVKEALAAYEGDILVFLPGMAEIRRTEALLAGAKVLVLPLHGDLSMQAQDLALRQHDRRRVVLATSIAETSLTVPGVRVVIDGGFRRAPRLDVSSGLTRLATMRISRAAAVQRSGRAGREGPGVGIRLWSEALHRGLAPFERAEIFEAELSGLVLACAAWGERPEDLPFVEAPPAGALTAARALLADLGALDGELRLTALGREMAKLRAAPRLAAMMCAADSPQERALAADLAAILEERDFLLWDAPVDVLLRLEALAGRGAGDGAVMARVKRGAEMYRARLGLRRDAVAAGDAGALLAAAFTDRIGQARGEPGAYRLAGGGSANIGPADPMARNKLIVVAGLDAKGAKVRLAAKLDGAALPGFLEGRLKRTRETAFDPATGGISTRERVRLGALILSDAAAPAQPAEIQGALAKAVAARLESLDWSEAVLNFLARAAFMRGIDPAFTDVSREALGARVDEWLTPYLAGMTNIRDVRGIDLLEVLRAYVGYERARELDKLLPVALELPNGTVKVDYTGAVPVAAARAKVFYGLDATPQLAGGKVPLQIALLSPAGRAIAVTGDLASFWRNGWVDARKDMRGRYPKHDWPEHPWR